MMRGLIVALVVALVLVGSALPAVDVLDVESGALARRLAARVGLDLAVALLFLELGLGLGLGAVLLVIVLVIALLELASGAIFVEVLGPLLLEVDHLSERAALVLAAVFLLNLLGFVVFAERFVTVGVAVGLLLGLFEVSATIVLGAVGRVFLLALLLVLDVLFVAGLVLAALVLAARVGAALPLIADVVAVLAAMVDLLKVVVQRAHLVAELDELAFFLAELAHFFFLFFFFFSYLLFRDKRQ